MSIIISEVFWSGLNAARLEWFIRRVKEVQSCVNREEHKAEEHYSLFSLRCVPVVATLRLD